MYAAAGVVAVTLALSNMPTPFYVRWQATAGFPSAVLTLLFSAYILGLLISLAISGRLVRRIGPRRVALPGLILAMAASLVFAFERSESALLVARAMSGLAVGAVLAAGIPWIADSGGPDRRLALSIASGAVAGGAGIGPLLSGLTTLSFVDPICAAFLIEFGMLACAVTAVMVLPSKHGGSGRNPVTATLPRVTGGEQAALLQGIACFGCALATTAFVLSLGPSVLRYVSGADSPLAAGAMASAMFLTGAIVQVPVKKPAMLTPVLG